MKKYILNRKIQALFAIFLLVIVAGSLQLLQVQNRNLYLGYDWVFHYNRFYDAAQQIKEGNFQYFISMYGFTQSGRIVNALYGPMFAYFNGLLILITKSWFNYQLLTNFLITFLASLSMFILLIKNNIRIRISFFLSIMYVTFYLVQAWTFNQVFHAWGAVIFPLGVLAGLAFFKSNEGSLVKKILFLTFAMTLAVQVHVLTTLFLVILLSIFFVLAFFSSDNKVRLVQWVSIAAVLTICTTANVWYPLLEVNLENTILPPFFNANMDKSALKLSFQTLPTHLTITVFSLYIFQFILLFFVKPSKTNRIVTILAYITFIASTRIFPWNELISIIPNISLIQFPSRLLMPSVILVLLGIGLSLEQLFKQEATSRLTSSVIYLVLFSCLSLGVIEHLQSSYIQSQYWFRDTIIDDYKNTGLRVKKYNPDEIRNSFFKSDQLLTPLDVFSKTTPDYIPLENKKLATDPKFKPYKEYGKTIVINPLNKRLVKTVENNKLKLSWEATRSSEVIVPIFIYHRTEVTFNGKLLTGTEIKKNRIGNLLLNSAIGENELSIYYKNSVLFYVALGISIFSWIMISIWGSIILIRDFFRIE
ncbi:hypothetical protein DOK78_001518 [Enterococcus sp. DIV2402]|uniref:Membrane protein 6-pyruvoyl-tetrahydropterin synthase-related domain-containing protein n=1 Tax=Candidatus Enterococcus lowellii TaxID=2230877 RepID=A0ABZ2SR36_9ENTE|nr:hypothetical protein [Enterococcus sp. DIV2402]MBO0464293.1 hypothetical protein [Enterococcus sp. DIV2402]